MRVALLPTPGDPFVLSYWLRNFERVWGHEIDELLVHVNGADPEHGEFLRSEIARVGGRAVCWLPSRIGHGEALEELLHVCDADSVLLMEDDAYVRRSGAIEDGFLRLELEGVVLGTPRGGMHASLYRAALERWGPAFVSDHKDGTEHAGHGLWPCFLFAPYDALDRVRWSAGFAARSWPPGSIVPGLCYEVSEPGGVDTDTFSAAAFMLRDSCRVEHVPQYKELWQKNMAEDDDPFWFHAGGLSNLYWRHGTEIPEGIGGSYEGLDWAHRVWWWRRALDTAPRALDAWAPIYRARLDELVVRAGIAEQVADWGAILTPWITWDDRA